MPELQPYAAPKVAVAGWGVISAAGSDANALRTALQNNASGIRPAGRFDHPRYQSNHVAAALPDVDEENPAHRLAAAALSEARRHAGPTLAKTSTTRLGLVLATTKANIEALER